MGQSGRFGEGHYDEVNRLHVPKLHGAIKVPHIVIFLCAVVAVANMVQQHALGMHIGVRQNHQISPPSPRV